MPGQRLTLKEREIISRGLVAEKSFREIGRELERPASTVSREVDRNGGRTAYRACDAHLRRRTSGRGVPPSPQARHPSAADP